MNLSLIDIIFLILCSLLFCFWWQSKAVKERAVTLVKKYCNKMDIQLLDETISIKKNRIIWHQKQFKIKRFFTFEFTSTGESRYQGEIIFLNNSLESITIETHKI